MIILVVMLGLAASMALLFRWAFRVLPQERWQFLAVIPALSALSGQWQGRNFTFYGFFIASAYAVALLLMLVLAGALSIPVGAMLVICGLILAIGIAASRWIAGWVEKKKNTFTVGGASFVCLVAAPWIVAAYSRITTAGPESPLPVIPIMAALAVAYCFGEGLGRLACISFGCCYGRPLTECPPLIRGLFSRRAFVFAGKTKKIAYERSLDGVAVVPIQAITASVNIGAGWLSLWLFLCGHFTGALLVAISVSQAWRIISEGLRADFRGNLAVWPGTFSSYQVMAALSLGYALLLPFLFPPPQSLALDLAQGLKSVWSAGIVIFIEGVWLLVFFYQGLSRVTASTLAFYVRRDKI
ncbi:MAG: prolipoprotein diacylglyceryl transferase [Kiritimatiellia bacterium]|jgi:hypothetical protein